MRYSVKVRHVPDSGLWEEWEVWVDARDEVAALAKVLRRRAWAERLLEPGQRHRFAVEPVVA